MATFFLVIIYLAFISLGLPDSILGVSWSLMQSDFGAPFETAGILFMTIAGSTIISSFISGALLGFYFSPSIIWLFICAIPLGLGAGAVDSGLNNYVASHYKAHHMSWLHCFWGVGATLGPIIMAQFLTDQNSWRDGYLAIAGLQFVLVIILFFSLPLWNKIAGNSEVIDTKELENLHEEDEENKKPIKIKGVKLAMISFFFYCGAEATVGLWGSSFLVNVKDLSVDVAARWVSLYYGGITVGRFITGFITLKVNNRKLIAIGQMIALAGAILLFLPLPSVFSLVGFILIGLGLAPIFPCMLHETPTRFGKKHSQTIMGYQMAFAYTGSTFLPPLLGFVAGQTTIGIFPFVVAGFIAFMVIGSEKLNALMKKKVIDVKNSSSTVM